MRQSEQQKEMKKLFEEAGLRNVKQKRNFLFAVMTVGEKDVKFEG